MKFYKLVDTNPGSNTYLQPLGVMRSIGDKFEWFRNARWVNERALKDEVSLLIVEGSEFTEISLNEANEIVKFLSGL